MAIVLVTILSVALFRVQGRLSRLQTSLGDPPIPTPVLLRVGQDGGPGSSKLTSSTPGVLLRFGGPPRVFVVRRAVAVLCCACCAAWCGSSPAWFQSSSQMPHKPVWQLHSSDTDTVQSRLSLLGLLWFCKSRRDGDGQLLPGEAVTHISRSEPWFPWWQPKPSPLPSCQEITGGWGFRDLPQKDAGGGKVCLRLPTPPWLGSSGLTTLGQRTETASEDLVLVLSLGWPLHL